MLQRENASPVRTPLARRMIQGGFLGLLLISLFLWSADKPDPSWSKYWMIRPLVIVTIAGAMGGLFYYLMAPLRSRSGWIAVLATIISIIGVLIALWMGTVVGLDGTYWD